MSLKEIQNFCQKLNRSSACLSLAITFCSSIIFAQGHDPYASNDAFVAEGFVQLQAGNPDDALKAFEKALANNARELSALLGRAMIYAKQLEHEKAFASFDSIVRQHPRHIDAWGGRGTAAFNLGDFDEALNSFKAATANKPMNGSYYESLAWTQICRGEFEQAAATAKTATLMYGRSGETAVYPLLIAYFSYLEIGAQEQASRTLKYAQKNSPVDEWPMPVIGYLAGKIDENELISFVVDTTQETEAHTYIGLKLQQDDQLDRASQHLGWVSKHGDPRVFEHTLARTVQLRNSVAIHVL